jgi:hypothetical protein
MKDFEYCLWCIPPPDHPWHKWTKGFTPHLSIKTNIKTVEKAYRLLDNLPDKKPIQIKISYQPVITHKEGFYAIQYPARAIGKPPTWWPSDAHISFAYSYQPFTTKEIKSVVDTITVFEANLSIFQVKKCSGHYMTWNHK